MQRLTRDAILTTFASYGRPREQWLVGGEFERHLLKPDGVPLNYFEPGGIKWMLETFGARGWEVVHEGDNPIAAWKDGASITLEPGCQFELSGKPHHNVVDVMKEAEDFCHRVDEVLAEGGTGAKQVALGFTPYVKIDDIPWVPKGRYVQMREFLPQFGDLAHHMMKGTCAVQVSFDFLDEQDCANKMAVSNRLAPLTVALFANSSVQEGRLSDHMSYRGHIWTRTDPARTGVPSDREFTYEGWIDYLLDVPMMFIKQGGRYINGKSRSFRSWMEDGIDGQFPTWDDWDLHLTQVFPEVRVKKQIEVRGADCVPLPLAGAFCAMWEGLFYCNISLQDTLELSAEFASHGTKEQRFDIACKEGLHGVIGGRSLLDWGREVTYLASRALGDCARHDLHLLDPLLAQLDEGASPARALQRVFQQDPRPEAFLPRVGMWDRLTDV